MYLTDIVKGIFIIEFSYQKAAKKIVVKSVNFIDMPKLLSSQHKKIPYDATFQAIKLLSSKYDANGKQYNEKLIVTTGVYHSFQIELVYDLSGQIRSQTLTRIFLRYAFYIV